MSNVKQAGYNVTIMREEVLIEHQHTGPVTGKIRIAIKIPDGLSPEEAQNVNRALRKATIPLVYVPGDHVVTHVRTGLTKDATDCTFWLTPDGALSRPAQGR